MADIRTFTPITKVPPLPADFPGILRELADRAEKGEVFAFAGIYTADNQYQFILPSSLQDSLMLASFLQYHCCERFKE